MMLPQTKKPPNAKAPAGETSPASVRPQALVICVSQET
jgi:hypothetical protein